MKISANNGFADLLEKFRLGRNPVFSLGPFWPIETMRLKQSSFNRALQEPQAMAQAALAKIELGFDSTVLPLDINIEAEALGAVVRYHEDKEGIPIYPTIAARIFKDGNDVTIPDDLVKLGRIPAILSAIALTRALADGRGAVGAFVPGPFTLAGQMMDMDEMFIMAMKKPDGFRKILRKLTEALKGVRDAYVEAGAQYIVVQEGGATAAGPRIFADQILPCLQSIFTIKQVPHVLSVAGNANHLVGLMLQCGADGIGIDQSSDADRVRAQTPPDTPLAAVIGDKALLATQEPQRIREMVRHFLDKNLTLVMPPADIYPPAKIENITAFVDEARSYLRFSSVEGSA